MINERFGAKASQPYITPILDGSIDGNVDQWVHHYDPD